MVLQMVNTDAHMYPLKVSRLQCVLVHMMWTKQTNTEYAMTLTQTTVGGKETPTTLPTTPARSDQSPSMTSGPQGASTEHATMQTDGKHSTIKSCTVQ